MSRPSELSGWKAISDYLGVSVRAAQGYERDRGLPVFHQPGTKGRVFADPEALDSWRKKPLLNSTARASTDHDFEISTRGQIQGGPEGSLSQSSNGAGVHRRQWLRYGLLAGSAAIGVAAVARGIGWLWRRREQPAAYRVEGATLVVLGEGGTELWRHTFPEQMSEDFYKSPLHCLFQDLDGDGKVETVFHYGSSIQSNGCLICFDSSGHQRWEFQAGRNVTDNLGREFERPYWINSFAAVRDRDAATADVVVSSNHHFSFPNQVAVIDGKSGRIVNEYWHRGHLLQMVVSDVDGDGKPEVLLGGVNDAPEYKQATLVVFDHRQISGASKTPSGGTYFQGIGPGTEKAVVFFPKTPISKQQEFNRAAHVIVGPGRITVAVAEGVTEDQPGIVYELDNNFKPIQAVLDVRLGQRYRELQDSGKLPKEPLEAVAERLLKEVTIIKRT